MPPSAPEPPRWPPPRVAGVVVALEAVLLLGVAVWQEGGVLAGEAQVAAVAQGTAVYFLLLAVVVAGLAVAVWRGARAAFGAAVFVQVLALPLVATMAVERFWPGALVLGSLAVLGLVTLLSAPGRAAFGRP
jgi:uncharacterized membrane protein